MNGPPRQPSASQDSTQTSSYAQLQPRPRVALASLIRSSTRAKSRSKPGLEAVMQVGWCWVTRSPGRAAEDINPSPTHPPHSASDTDGFHTTNPTANRLPIQPCSHHVS